LLRQKLFAKVQKVFGIAKSFSKITRIKLRKRVQFEEASLTLCSQMNNTDKDLFI